MRFSVEEPDATARAIVAGPKNPCWQQHEQCAFYAGGPCTQIDCTCETSGVCMSCPPRSHGRWR